MITILQGDAIEKLRTLPDGSVQCCVTSPPYWGLRDYGVAGQLGLEKTPEEYVAKMVAVFREVRRVLREDGTLWLNMGDSYANDGKWGGTTGGKHVSELHGEPIGRSKRYTGLKPKDLIGIPWRLAFALQADGWYLRSDIVWSKPNPMPESVTDRPTKSHEYIFLLSKAKRYYYDAAAVAERCASGPSDLRNMAEGLDRIDAKHFHVDPGPLAKANPNTNIGNKRGVGGLRYAIGSPGPNSRMYQDRDPQHAETDSHAIRKSGNKERDYEGRLNHKAANIPWEGFRRNLRTVWTVATVPYKEAHFATFPPDLIKPCILAGSKPGDTVIDPFGGSGTTGLVAIEHGRNAILIELNLAYCNLAKQRTNVTPGLAIA